jgi:pSer/pThr/pTyr-binding forkhead associated (FHA) protein
MDGAYLRVVAGPREGAQIPLVPGRPVIIGRKRGELLLDDPMVSSAHCQLLLKDGEVLLEDLGSTNGTRVQGARVREAALQDGAEIEIGGSRLVVHVADAQARPATDDNTQLRASPSQLGSSWLLDGEHAAQGERGRPEAALIGQDLRLPPGLNAVVEVVAGLDAGKVFRFSRGSVSIGRRQGEVPLTDVEVSRDHAVIEVFGREMIFVRDMGSTNGTYHNGRRIEMSRLRNGDSVGCGKTILRLQISV